MIFIDSNIPRYLVGADHPHKDRARFLVSDLVEQREILVTDAEALQEILHRYHAIHRLDALDAALETMLVLVDRVFPISQDDVTEAKDLLVATRGPSARDAIHVAVMARYQVNQILTFDRGFDKFSGIERLH